jgi:hypothetical protein
MAMVGSAGRAPRPSTGAARSRHRLFANADRITGSRSSDAPAGRSEETPQARGIFEGNPHEHSSVVAHLSRTRTIRNYVLKGEAAVIGDTCRAGMM